MASAVNAEHANSQQRWSLVLYRDEGDEYLVRHFDFRSDLEEFQTILAEQSYDGGGDFPEAPEQALDITGQLAWRSDDAAARLAFWRNRTACLALTLRWRVSPEEMA